MKTILISFQLIFLFVINIQAKTYYCNPNKGAIINKGTKEYPLPSLEEVLASKLKLQPGDTLFLMSGNHGTINISGINPKEIFILAAPNEKPLMEHLSIAKNAPASNWFIQGIEFISNNPQVNEYIKFYPKSMFITIKQCKIFDKNISNKDIDTWKQKVKEGIVLEGIRNRLLNNSLINLKTAIHVKGNTCRIEGNKIAFFSNFGILCEGSNNKFVNNLIKNYVHTGFNAAAFKALGNTNRPNKANILLGNVIVDYTDPNMPNIAPLMGIVGFEGNYDKWIIENNVIITDHWHGITFFNIKNSKIINNTVIDPYLGTNYPSLGKEAQNKTFGPVRIWISKNNQSLKSEKNLIANNLISDLLIEDSLGLISNNLKVPSSYSLMDKYFEKWDYLNFHLQDSAMAVNAGILKYAPKIDADGTPRPIGKTVNVGAYEYSNIQAGNMNLEIVAEIQDVELRNNGQKHDWDGQKSIRIGGVGAGFDGVMVIPFALPPLPYGYEIKSATFSAYLEKTDNSPMGSINLHGLIPRKSPDVLQSDYYQGDISGDLTARPIQQDFLGKNKGATIKTSTEGSSILKDYLNSVYQSGAQAGDFIFLRLSPSSKDVKDYHRWVFSSANADDFEKKPKLLVVIGPANNQLVQKESKEIIAVSPDVLYDGCFYVKILNKTDNQTKFQILNEKKEIVFEDTFAGNTYSSKNKIKLLRGIYFFKKNNYIKPFNIW